uniref:Uncharacterized protein n=1 Tax=viral metagenome TaxID=1070528 RepID=A0A6H1ZGP2_9ZZZZ
MKKNLKNLKKFYKNNTAVSVVILLALIIGLPTIAYNSFDDRVIDRIADKYLEGVKEVALGAITMDKTTFDHGIEILSEGLDVTGAADFNSAFNVDGAATLTSTLVVSGTTDVSRFTQGGSILATSTDGITTSVLTEAQLIANASIDFTLSTEATHTLTLPATSTMTTFIPTAGDTAFMRIRVLGTAASASSTIAAGTGIDLIENENGDVIIEAGNEAYLRFHRETDTDVTVSVDEYIAAD